MERARDISNFIIAWAHECGDPLSNLKLQKLLYYAQAWHLAIFDTPLFSEQIEAWVHGPVVPAEYRRFKSSTWQPIMEDPAKPEFDRAVMDHLDEVMRVYGGMTAEDLELLSHSEAPWKNARNGLAMDEPSNAVISHEDMKTFYRAAMNG